MQAFQFLLRFAVVARIVYGVTLRVRIVGFESYINAYLLSSRLVDDGTFCLDCELHIVAVSTMHNPDSLDLFCRECCNLLLRVAYQSQASNTTAISEGDVLAIRF